MIVPVTIKAAEYVIPAINITISGINLVCNPSGTTLCGFEFKAYNTVSVKSSQVAASLIMFDGDIQNFQLGFDSILNATGRGNLKGPTATTGYNKDMGASYAGQGGTQLSSPPDYTYGTLDQTPFDDKTLLHYAMMGSGGNDEGKRGGGAIIIITKTGTISGMVQANGNPSLTKVTPEYHAGSGGYIYINCTDTP